jgi:hypothetical protein
MGLSRREFAKSEGTSEGAVRFALKQGRLVARPDGTLDAIQLGGRWKRNNVGASKRVKREAPTAQSAEVTHRPAQIPFDVQAYYGWNDPDFDPEVTDGIATLLCLKGKCRDPKMVASVIALHGSSMLQREAYLLGWRESEVTRHDDESPIGPEASFSSMTAQLLNFGLVRKLGRAMQPDTPGDPDAVVFDIGDPIEVANHMIFLAAEIFDQELERRRKETVRSPLHRLP